MEKAQTLDEPNRPQFKVNQHHRLRNNCWASRAQVLGVSKRLKRGSTANTSELNQLNTRTSETSAGSKKRVPRPKFGVKNAFYGSQPYLLGTNIKQKIGIYQANGCVKPSLRTLEPEGDFNQKRPKLGKKRPFSRSKKRKRTRSNKKRSTNFLNNYVNEKYNEYKRKESQNNFIKSKLYKEIGMPPLALGEKKENKTMDKRHQVTSDTSKNFESKKEVTKTLDTSEPNLEYNKQLGLFRKVRPKTPAAVVRNPQPKPKRAFSAKQRRSSQKVEPSNNKYHKLFQKININSIQQFTTPECGDLKDYEFSHKIGKGAYATVKLAYHKPSKQNRAVKLYDRSKLVDSMRKQSLIKEIKILKRSDHPNIIKLHESLDTSKYVYLVTEYISGPSLLKYLKSKPNRQMEEAEIKHLWRQVVEAINYLHNKNITHRDVKLENILLTEDCKTVKLIDFGFSTCCSPYKKLKIYCGTPSYMAPQIVQRREYHGPPADVWACGVLLYTMFCGRFPFKGSSDKELYRKIMKGLYNTPEHVPRQVKTLLSKILEVDPHKRLTAQEILIDDWLI